MINNKIIQMGLTYSTNTQEKHEPYESCNREKQQAKKQKDDVVCLNFYKSRKDNKFGCNKFTEKNTTTIF